MSRQGINNTIIEITAEIRKIDLITTIIMTIIILIKDKTVPIATIKDKIIIISQNIKITGQSRKIEGIRDQTVDSTLTKKIDMNQGNKIFNLNLIFKGEEVLIKIKVIMSQAIIIEVEAEEEEGNFKIDLLILEKELREEEVEEGVEVDNFLHLLPLLKKNKFKNNLSKTRANQ